MARSDKMEIFETNGPPSKALHFFRSIYTARAYTSTAEKIINGRNFSLHFTTNEIASLELKTRLFARTEKAFHFDTENFRISNRKFG